MSKIRLHGSSSGYTEIAPVAASGNNTLTLPNDGTIISKDSAGAVGVTSVVTDTIKVGAAVTIGESGVNVVGVVTATSGIVGLTSTGMPAGSVLQVKQTVKTDTFSSTTTGSDVDITGLSVSITPTSDSNKILVTYDTNISGSNAGYSGNIHLKRGSTKIYQGDAEGSRTRSTQFFITRNDTIGHLETIKVHGQFLDSPNTTSETTYKISFNAINTHTTVNKTMYDSDASGVSRVPSTITVMEIAA